MSFVIGYLSFVICHLSFVICHLSFVICHLSFVICHLSFVIGNKLKVVRFVNYHIWSLSTLQNTLGNFWIFFPLQNNTNLVRSQSCLWN
ncbi:MAG: hypothetical protein F6K31_39890 [Symploca sp. SIO2G7]|nr:hypothetical protein [Symploca sp. SIO2G7]